MTAAFACSGCSKKTEPGTAAPSTGENHTTASVDGSEENLQAQQNKDLPVLNWEEMSPTGSMDLLYADQFSADYYEDGIASSPSGMRISFSCCRKVCPRLTDFRLRSRSFINR